MRVAIIYNTKKKDSFELVQQMAAYIRQRGGQVVGCDGLPGTLIGEMARADFSGCDAAITLGGDGTMLAVMRHLAKYEIPLFGVNMGNVGFLTATEQEGALGAVAKLLDGEYETQERLMLAATLRRKGREIANCTAMNEIAVSSGVNSRSVTLDLAINQEAISSYNADGIIVATPTGSTGYSLSAGGPIVMEDLEVIVVTPLCSHSFFSRPIVVDGGKEIEIVNRSSSHAASLTADGQFRFSLERHDEIAIYRSRYNARLIRFAGETYFERIKNKLYV